MNELLNLVPETIKLSEKDAEWMADLIQHPPKPNARLQAAVVRYREVIQEPGEDAHGD